MKLNVDRLLNYRKRLVVFPRRTGIIKNGDSSAAEIAEATQINVDIKSIPKKTDAVTFITITDEMKAGKGYAAIRGAWTDARLVGKRAKAKLAKSDEKAAPDA